MAFIKSISGFRGTIGGERGSNLTPQDIVECAAAYGTWLKNRKITEGRAKVIIGRDARISGAMVSGLVANTLLGLGIDVVDLGLSTTPTVEVAVPMEGADGGIILTASHNPKEWNALKLLNEKGEFISGDEGKAVLALADAGNLTYVSVDDLGKYTTDDSYIQKHIDTIFALDLVDVELVRSKGFKVAVDPVNSTGTISIVPLLEQLGCEVFLINGDVTGNFAHNPEPLPEHLNDLSRAVTFNRANLGISVDPDVDRLAFVCEDGEMFGEEYTLVAIADYILQNTPGSTVSNLSSTRALRTITEGYGQQYASAAVGEVNVVTKMKEIGAVIGGEGNGGIIYPELHYGRDALVGVALMLTYLAKFGKSIGVLRQKYPDLTISKKKLDLPEGAEVDVLLEGLAVKYKQVKNIEINQEDGLKIMFEEGNWIHMRKSNTEPIIRVYAESSSPVIADNLIQKMNQDIYEILNADRMKLSNS